MKITGVCSVASRILVEIAHSFKDVKVSQSVNWQCILLIKKGYIRQLISLILIVNMDMQSKIWTTVLKMTKCSFQIASH